MLMEGISPSLFWGGVLGLVLVSGLLWLPLRLSHAVASSSSDYSKLDLLRYQPLASFVRWRPFQFIFQVLFVLTFLLIIVCGLLGTQVTYLNLAPILTWNIWWGGLIFAILFFGKIWCLVCPWNAIATWLQRLTFWARSRLSLSLNLRWPRRWRNIYIATGLFMLLTWLELGFGVTTIPWATAGLGILMLAMALVSAIYFERQSFCRYACLVGRVSGLYSMFAPLEVRARDKDLCRQCPTKDCFRGNDRGYPCPTFEFLGAMELNTYCILCSECVKSCPENNVAFNLRPFANDLLRSRQQRTDEAYLALVMLSMTSFHGLTMTPSWGSIQQALSDFIGLGSLGNVLAFTLGMAGIIALPIVLWLMSSKLAIFASASSTPSLKSTFVGYAYALLPVALFYHLAHNVEHLLSEGQRIVYLISDPFGWSWDLFGTAQWRLDPLISLPTIQAFQVVFVVIGQGMAVLIARHVSRRLFPQRREPVRSLVVMVGMLLAFSLANLVLLAQPMHMRSTM